MNIIINAIKILFLLGFLVTIHEAGHFFVAKFFKIKVNEFAIGFGPTIWKKNSKETKYALRLIPLGGFVNLEGEDGKSNEPGSFSNASIFQKICVLIAGGTVNIIFGLIVFFFVMTATGGYVSTTIEELSEGYNAINSGLQIGDEILKINNKRVRTIDDINEIMSNSSGEEVAVLVKRNDEKKYINVLPTKIDIKQTGIYLDGENTKEATIVQVNEKSPAEEAGLTIGDVIIKINDIATEGNPQKVSEIINKENDDVLEFLIKRNDEEITIKVVPETVSRYYLGIKFEVADDNLATKMYYSLFETEDLLVNLVDNFKMLFTGRIKADQLMGPVGISSVVSSTKNINEYIYIIAIISISLGTTNLIPFPPLDGGKILLLIIEAIKRKPLKEETDLAIQTLGFLILIALSIYVTFNDIIRI